MGRVITLAELPVGQTGTIRELVMGDRSRRRLLDLGLVPRTRVEALRVSPSGDPTAYQIRGAVIALRSEETQHILVEI